MTLAAHFSGVNNPTVLCLPSSGNSIIAVPADEKLDRFIADPALSEFNNFVNRKGVDVCTCQDQTHQESGCAEFHVASSCRGIIAYKQKGLQQMEAFHYRDKRFSLDFFYFDRILKVIRIQTILTSIGGLALRIHKKRELRSVGFWQFHIMRIVVRQPVHLPSSKKLGSRFFHSRIVQLQKLRRLLLQHHFPYIRGIHGHPSVPI